jgi:hypothetical protein
MAQEDIKLNPDDKNKSTFLRNLGESSTQAGSMISANISTKPTMNFHSPKLFQITSKIAMIVDLQLRHFGTQIRDINL